MSSDSDETSRRAGLTERLRSHAGPVGAIGIFLVGLVYFGALLGFRGLASSTVDFLKGAHRLMGSLGKGVGPNDLATDHPGAELLLGLTLQPGGGALGWWPLIGMAAGAAALAAIWGIARKRGGPIAGLMAAGALAAIPAVGGAATAPGPSIVFLAIWCWFLRLSVVERHRWYSAPILWLLGALLVLIYPAFLVWGLAWLYLELRRSERDALAEARALDGEIPAGGIPLVILVAPVAILALATLLHPGFWSDPVAGWKKFFEFALTNADATFHFAGTTYEHARPPLWMGLVLYWWVYPALLVVGSAIGWVLAVAERSLPGARTGELVRAMGVWGLPLACLAPWLTRGPSYGVISFELVAAPFVALLFGLAVTRIIEGVGALTEPTVGRLKRAALVGGVVAVALGFTAFGAHPVQGSYYNGAAGGFTRAVSLGLPTSRDEVFPLSVLRRAGDEAGDRGLYVAGNGQLVDTYAKNGWVDGLQAKSSAFSAGALLRRVGSFETGTDSVRTNNDAIVDLRGEAVPLLSVDGIPLYWLERR